MKATRTKGTVLTLVIMAMGLMAVAMLVLTEGANLLLAQADTAYCRAVERNLTASALAWGQSQLARDGMVAAEEPVMLDSRLIGDQRTALTAQFTRVGADDAEMKIETSCSKGRRTVEQSRQYAIARP
ncbi:MAG: hypothetical protein JW993_03980 [Sedimentisphaerales bacterium]|nr:hypothetical protein [Sedimentisphaerales bacterium]